MRRVESGAIPVGVIGPFGGRFWAAVGRFRDILGRFRAILGRFRAILGNLGLFWGCAGWIQELFRGFKRPLCRQCAIKGHFLHTTPLLCVENAFFLHIYLLKEHLCALNEVFLHTRMILCAIIGLFLHIASSHTASLT